MKRNTWTQRSDGHEHNTVAADRAAAELPDVNALMDAAGKCPECGGSGTVPVWTGAEFRLEERCPNGCRRR